MDGVGMKAFVRANYFFLGLLLAVGLAWLWPALGCAEGILPVSALKAAGVFVIFFAQGLALHPEALRRGGLDLRLHLCVQSSGYLLIPLLSLLLWFLSAPFFARDELRGGFLYLAILPTTITSAVAFTSLARGNVAGALFNTTLSNVAGVFLVPAICLSVLSTGSGISVPAGPILAGVACEILLPLALGQALRPFLGRFAERHGEGLRRLNLGIILFIVYAAFCQSFARGVWASVGLADLLATVLLVGVLLSLNSVAVWTYSGLFHLSWESRVAALFCGSQKTLAAGLPLATAIFGAIRGGPELSVLLLPLLIYHPAQLLLGGWLVPRLREAPVAPVG